MKISELVSKLEELKVMHGDLNVEYASTSQAFSCDIRQITPVYQYSDIRTIKDKPHHPIYIELI